MSRDGDRHTSWAFAAGAAPRVTCRRLERIFATAVEVVEVIDVAQLARAVAGHDVAAVALDAPGPEDLADAITAAGPRPVLRPLWRQERNRRGEVNELFDSYGIVTAAGVERLADGQLQAP